MKILLTGASGFIGRQMLEILTEQGIETHAVSKQSTVETKGRVQWHHVDLLEDDQRRTLMESVRPTHVLHTAWIATPGVYWTSPLNEDWLEATRDLLSLSKEVGVERFVGAGTCAEYDWTGDGHCDERTTPLIPATFYGQKKAAAGEAVIGAAADDFSTAWGRIFFLYGPHEHPNRLISSVILSMLHGKPVECTHGKQIRDFMHVHDVAAAFVAMLLSDVQGAVNIASGEPVSLREAVETVADIVGGDQQLLFGAKEAPANDPPSLTASVDRLQTEVGWKPSFTLRSGLEDSVRWWQSQS